MDILTDTELTKTIEKFTGIILPRKERINQSSENQLKVFKILEENFLLSEPDAELGLLFSDDVKYYNRLIENYERI